MIIDRKQFFTIVRADEGKLLKDSQGIYQMLYVPKTKTDDELKAIYEEVDNDNFIVKFPVQSEVYSKLQIRRACRELGIESKLNDLLNSNEIFASDWSDAQDIDLADSILLQALKEGKFTDEEIDKIKALCHG